MNERKTTRKTPPPVCAGVGGVGTAVRPGRGRTRATTVPEDKVKKPADGARKKSPPLRKAPPRGRYVDEYAGPRGLATGLAPRRSAQNPA
ncbi:MAG: hypothetical protein ACYC5S_07790 [Thiobacillus sp.]